MRITTNGTARAIVLASFVPYLVVEGHELVPRAAHRPQVIAV